MNLKSVIFVLIIISCISVVCSCKNKIQAKPFVENQDMQEQKKDNVIIDKSDLSKEEILSWNYDEALVKLGNTVSQDSFTMFGISEFRVELLNFLPADSALIVKELTWQTDSLTNLTVWYVQKNILWKPIHFLKWQKGIQF